MRGLSNKTSTNGDPARDVEAHRVALLEGMAAAGITVNIYCYSPKQQNEAGDLLDIHLHLPQDLGDGKDLHLHDAVKQTLRLSRLKPRTFPSGRLYLKQYDPPRIFPTRCSVTDICTVAR